MAARSRLYRAGLARTYGAIAVQFGDIDNDGDLDLYAPIGGAMFGDRQPNSLYWNNGTPHHWLKLRLIGTVSNPDAIGTRIAVTTSQGARYLTVAGGTGFGSMNDPVVLVGLGTATHVNTVDIHWPSGRRQILTDLAADQMVVITKGEIAAAPRPGPP
jgi:hypothetical protein